MKPRGLTLLELMIGLAITAVVAVIALPTFAGVSERARLRHAAETLASDLGEARFESARAGRPLHVAIDAAPSGWCWNVATTPGCDCHVQASCQLKTAQQRDHGGIEMLDAQGTAFEPDGQARQAGGATFRSPRGEMLRVSVSRLGRASVCSPEHKVPGYPACPGPPAP